MIVFDTSGSLCPSPHASGIVVRDTEDTENKDASVGFCPSDLLAVELIRSIRMRYCTRVCLAGYYCSSIGMEYLCPAGALACPSARAVSALRCGHRGR
jgi:hypothetical protein